MPDENDVANYSFQVRNPHNNMKWSNADGYILMSFSPDEVAEQIRIGEKLYGVGNVKITRRDGEF